MKHFLSFRKRKLFMLSLVAALFMGGGTIAKAETLTESFDDVTVTSRYLLSNGWVMVHNNGNYQGFGGSYDYQIKSGNYDGETGNSLFCDYSDNNEYVVIPTKLTGTFSYYVKRSSSSNGTVTFFEATKDGDNFTITTTQLATTSTSSSWASKSFDLGDEGKYVAIRLLKSRIDQISATIYEEATGPALAVKDGSTKLTSPYSYNFGLTTAGTTHTFTLSNPGTADLGVSVSETGNFGATLSAATIAAGGEVTLTVTMPATTGSSEVTITPASGSGIDPFVINVSGSVRDENKIFIDFADNAMPATWSFDSGWSTSGGFATVGSTAAYIRSGKIVSTGEDLIIQYKGNGTTSWYSYGDSYKPVIAVYWATTGNNSNADWTQAGTTSVLNDNDLRSSTYSIPAEAKYIAVYGKYLAVDYIYGLAEANEPNFEFSASDYSFGMISADATSSEFTLTNSGKGEQTGVSVTSNNDNFVVSTVPSTIAAKSTATFTVTMKADVKGMQNGIITVKADGVEDITFNVSGYVLDTDVIVVDFAENTVPEGWVNNGFTVSNNELSTTYYTRTLTSPAITVAEGQKLAIYAKGGSTNNASLTVKTSTDNGSTWTTAKAFTTELRNNTTDYVVLVVDNIAAGNYLLQLEGYYVTINTINGYTYNMNAPVMDFTAEDFAAGKVTANASKTYTVSNSGTGTLTVNITSDNEKFTVSPSQLVITDEAKEFTVTFNYAEGVYGKFNGNITVTPTYDETAAVTFAASAQVVDPNLWEEDFEDGTLPTGWVASNWTVGTFSNYENTTSMALAPNSSTAGTLTTPCLTAKAGDVLTWDAYLNWYDEALIVEYSADEQTTWTQIYSYKTQDDTEAPSTTQRYYHKAMSFTAPADGNYYLRFTSTYQNGVDNFSGFKLNLPDHIMAITASNIPSSSASYTTMKEGVSFNATVTLAESRGVNEEVTAKFYMGNEVIGFTTETVEASSTKVITIACTPTTAATDGVEMHIEVEWAGTTLTTEAVTRYVAASTKLELTETEEKEITTGTTYDVITLTRSFNAGWNTFVAPLAVNRSEFGEGAVIYSFTNYANGALSFSPFTDSSLNPATPYVVYIPTAMNKTFTWSNTSISSMYVGEDNIKTTHNGVSFQGTYAPIAAGGLTDNYGVTSEGKIMKAGANASIKGFRAYFTGLTTGVRMVITDEATGITKVIAADNLNEDVYNLQGQKVQHVGKGLYIINGKKVVKK